MVASNALQSWVTANIFRSPDQVSTVLQGEVVILNVKSSKYYQLNPVGSRIWELLEQPNRFYSIVDAIIAEYNVERDRCVSDVTNILHAMHEAGLIHISKESE